VDGVDGRDDVGVDRGRIVGGDGLRRGRCGFVIGGAERVGQAGEHRADGVGVGVGGEAEQRAEDVAERLASGAGLRQQFFGFDQLVGRPVGVGLQQRQAAVELAQRRQVTDDGEPALAGQPEPAVDLFDLIGWQVRLDQLDLPVVGQA
jgi:hypothetical protein